MAEKKIHENPLPEAHETESTAELSTTKPLEKPPTPATDKINLQLQKPSNQDKMAAVPDKIAPVQDKTVPIPDKMSTTVPLPPVTPVSPRFSMPVFTKTSPNDLYRKLLPAMLFVLTFVTVMTMLLIYMDTVTLGAQKFRANMSRDYELASIAQGSAALVAFVQQLHLAPRHLPPVPTDPPLPTPQIAVMDRLYGEIYNGTFLEFLARGPRDGTALYLERARQWSGLVVRAAPRDYLALRTARPLHACLSPTPHPREVTYQESEGAESVFSSRVLCLPLLTVLLAADTPRADYVLVGGTHALPALTHLPFHDHRVRLQTIEVQFTNDTIREKTTQFLQTKNYTVAASFESSVMYTLKV